MNPLLHFTPPPLFVTYFFLMGFRMQMACLTEEILKEKGGWIPLYSGGGGSAKTVSISGFWQEEVMAQTLADACW